MPITDTRRGGRWGRTKPTLLWTENRRKQKLANTFGFECNQHISHGSPNWHLDKKMVILGPEQITSLFFCFFFLPPAKSPGSDSNQNGRAAAHNATRATVHWEDRQDPWHIHSYVQHRGFKYSSRGAGFRNCLHKHRGKKKKKNVRPTG